MKGDPTRLTILEVARAIRQQRVSCRAVVEASLDRARASKALNCFITLDADHAIAQADLCDRAMRRGRVRGPLHGVPLAHKDVFFTRDFPTTFGSRAFSKFRPDYDATVVKRLTRAGAIQLGKLNLSEFTVGGTGHNDGFGDCRNPRDPSRIPGGSSSGSGASVGAHIVYGSLGTDTGGSVRLPAACCGVVGLCPTRGRVSRHGVLPASWSLDCVGPIARTAKDVALLLSIIAGRDPRDEHTVNVPVPDYLKACESGADGIRIAIPKEDYFGLIDAEVRCALESAHRAFQRLGIRTTTVSVPSFDQANAVAEIVLRAEAATVHMEWLSGESTQIGPAVRSRMIEPGFFTPATMYLQALRSRGRLLERFMVAAFASADLLLLPVMTDPVPGVDSTRHSPSPELLALFRRIAWFTRGTNVLGLPAIAFPVALDSHSMPIGAQLIGPPFSEPTLLRAVAAFEMAKSD